MTQVEIGDGVVRRPAGPWSPSVLALLAHFERVGFDGAPRPLAIDTGGWELLEYVQGKTVRASAPPEAYCMLGGVRRLEPWAERWGDGRGGAILAGVAWIEENRRDLEGRRD